MIDRNFYLWMRSSRVVRATVCQCKCCNSPVAVFLVPDWGMKLVVASGCRNGLPSYIGWQAGTTIRRHGRLHTAVRD
jgi:hypothetical protein